MLHAVSTFIALFVFWILLSGYFTAFLLGAGAACALAVVMFLRRLDVIDHEASPLQISFKLAAYWIWLLKEIVKSAWDVSRIIVQPGLPISPTLFSFKPTQRTHVGLVIHANSITLTPGTISVTVEPGEFVVHALTRAGADGVLSGDMDARVSACEGKS